MIERREQARMEKSEKKRNNLRKREKKKSKKQVPIHRLPNDRDLYSSRHIRVPTYSYVSLYTYFIQRRRLHDQKNVI